jgi:PTS system mannose-specific IID component
MLAGLARGALVRSLLIQGSWNFRLLIGGGFAWMMIPALRRIHGEDAEAAIARHVEPFNSHPYLVGIAVGAVIRMEEEGVDPETIRRFKAAVRGPLGSLGDRLVWAAIRPTLLLLALLAWAVGGPPLWVSIGFLVAYNAVHLGLRWWGLQVGLSEGPRVARRLQEVDLARRAGRIGGHGAMALGVFCGVLVAGSLGMGLWGWVWTAAAAGGFGFGLIRGSLSIRSARLALVGAVVIITISGLV